MAADGDLYHRDFLAWTQEQAEALRAAARTSNLPIDWENLVEEIETLGRSERRELTSRLRAVIEHLLKLSLSPAEAPRQAWIETVDRTRDEIEDVLEENPSLRREVPALVARFGDKATRRATGSLAEFGELTPEARARLRAAVFTPDQVLGDWFPPPTRSP
jgi:hypothetical protein